MELGLSGLCVRKVATEFAIVMLLDDESQITVEVDSKLSGENGEVVDLAMDRTESWCQQLNSLEGRKIVSATTGLITSGDLLVEFEKKCSVYVPPSHDYEAWSVSAPREKMIISMPGGKLATWRG